MKLKNFSASPRFYSLQIIKGRSEGLYRTVTVNAILPAVTISENKQKPAEKLLKHRQEERIIIGLNT
ncbi:MAG: hypothetical protein SFU87_00270 [Chitinophagaceae bacterium]|nr:hypothetical protein [Chitinophagaceae bacterium]